MAGNNVGEGCLAQAGRTVEQGNLLLGPTRAVQLLYHLGQIRLELLRLLGRLGSFLWFLFIEDQFVPELEPLKKNSVRSIVAQQIGIFSK